MKQELLICTLVVGLGGIATADPSAEVSEAAKKLAAAKSYTTTSSMAFSDNEPRVSTVKKGAGGFSLVSYPGRDETRTVLIRGDKVAFQTDEGWQVADAEAEGDDNRRGRWMARMAKRYAEPPTERINELTEAAGELTAAEGTYSATLSEEAAKEMMSFRGRRGRGGDDSDRQPPPISGAGGNVKFMVEDGVLTGYELTLTGMMTFREQERDIGRTIKVEFTDIGSTTFDIPEEAAGLLAQ